MSRGLTWLRPDDGFGKSPQSERHQPDGGDPHDQGAAGLAGQGRQSARLIGAAARTERDAQNDVPDDQMQHAADRETGASGVLECIAVGGLVGDAV